MTHSKAISRSLRRSSPQRTRSGSAVLLAAGALVASAFINALLARRAERANPPKGKFLDVNGVRLHYVERGSGDALVLLHGNGRMIQDFETSGLIEMAASSYRVIVFDRPGYGYSQRPRGETWTANAQARLIHDALVELEVKSANILGHSWGASVAVALALQYPDFVSGLVLASGYYYPSVRSDVAAASAPAAPILGDILRYTVSPVLGRAMWPLILRKLFGPSSTPAQFSGFPVEMTLRPISLRASAAEAALMIPDAFAARNHYAELTMPVAIIAGSADKIVDMSSQSGRLHDELPHSTFDCVSGVGHMVHQIFPERVMNAIDRASGKRTHAFDAGATANGGARETATQAV